MDKPYQALPDIEVLPANFPVPGVGFLTINAFIIKAKDPVLIDTGLGIAGEEFMKALESVIDPPELKWIWLTHDDADHTGNIQRVLEAAPGARLAVNSLAALRMSTAWRVPMDRLYWLNPGDSITVGDRKLSALRPPLFDNPTTIGLYDNKSGIFFSADCFGALLLLTAQSIEEVPDRDLSQGMISWASGDNPWVHMVDRSAFNQTLDIIRRMAPRMILSSHLPLAKGKNEQLLQLLATVPSSIPFVAPNQTALEQILAEMKSGS